MLFNAANTFNWRLANATGQPTTYFGDAMTPGNNTMGSWIQLFSAAEVEHDVFGVFLNLQGVAGGINGIADIGFDIDGGSSYQTLIPNLLFSASSIYVDSGSAMPGGQTYYFPLFIPAGSSIAARCSTDGGGGAQPTVLMKLYGKPTRPDEIKAGRWVEALGIVGPSSSGTPITEGTTSEGAWTSLGSVSRLGWWAQMGLGISDSSMAKTCYVGDLSVGDESNKRFLIEEHVWYADSYERLVTLSPDPCPTGLVNPSETLYARLIRNGSANSNISIAAYILGG